MHIPKRLDAPMRVVLFEIDEFILGMMVAMVFYFTSQLLLFLLCTPAVVILYRRFKRINAGVNPLLLVYWIFPVKRHRVPPSNYRRYWG